MKIRKFLLHARSAHTPAPSEQFGYLSEDFQCLKRLEFLKLVSDGSLHYETVPCLCGIELFDNMTTADWHNISQFTNLCVHCGLVLNMPRLDHAAYTWLYSSGMYRDLYEGEGAAELGGIGKEAAKQTQYWNFLDSTVPELATGTAF